jgi:hypothetical protein
VQLQTALLFLREKGVAQIRIMVWRSNLPRSTKFAHFPFAVVFSELENGYGCVADFGSLSQ